MDRNSDLLSYLMTRRTKTVKFVQMSVAEIIDAVKELSPDEKGEFLDRLRDVDFEDAWDRQIEIDAKAGRLDYLWQQAVNDIESGRTKPLDEILVNS